MRSVYLLLAILFCGNTYAQDDLLDMLEDEAAAEEPENIKVTATFKANRVINAHTCETVKKKTLDFRITHRFGNIIEQTEGTGGFHQFFGFDNATDIRFSWDYGLTDNVQVGIARSKYLENIDGTFKWRFLHQTENFKIPVSLVWYSNAAFTPRKDPDSLYAKSANRFAYSHQLIIASKVAEWLSLEVLPTFCHRNVVRGYVDEDGNQMENTFFALGFAGRLRFTKRLALVVDYFHNFSKYRAGSIDSRDPLANYYSPLGIGIEIETGGHVFTINFTNSSGIIENAFLPYTTESWSTGAFKLGFNISRVFSF